MNVGCKHSLLREPCEQQRLEWAEKGRAKGAQAAPGRQQTGIQGHILLSCLQLSSRPQPSWLQLPGTPCEPGSHLRSHRDGASASASSWHLYLHAPWPATEGITTSCRLLLPTGPKQHQARMIHRKGTLQV